CLSRLPYSTQRHVVAFSLVTPYSFGTFQAFSPTVPFVPVQITIWVITVESSSAFVLDVVHTWWVVQHRLNDFVSRFHSLRRRRTIVAQIAGAIVQEHDQARAVTTGFRLQSDHPAIGPALDDQTCTAFDTFREL